MYRAYIKLRFSKLDQKDLEEEMKEWRQQRCSDMFFFFVDMELQKFNVIPAEKNYIQILHDSSLHWVCVANRESRKQGNEIHYLYNSLKKKHISKDVTHVTHPTHTILSRS